MHYPKNVLIKFYKYIFILSILIICSCTNNKEKNKNISRNNIKTTTNRVDITILSEKSFSKQVISNGILHAVQKSELKFELSGTIEKCCVNNGEIVDSGQILANIYDEKYRQKLQQAELKLLQSKIELEDLIIGIGYTLSDSSNIPKEKMKLLKIKAGYSNNLLEYIIAKSNLDNCKLVAPFSGRIANITQKPHDQFNGESFCTLINDSIFEVVFQIIENELKDIHLNDIVKIKPFAIDTTFEGNIIEINPVVSEDGLIQAKALVKNTGALLEGMNVKVFIENLVQNQFVVPKSAVVLRDNHKVLFKVVKGTAFWTYIITTMENSTSFAIIPDPDKNSASLSIGDTVIISGNLNLAHQSIVEIRNHHE